MSVATKNVTVDTGYRKASGALLDELKAAHDKLLGAIATLAALTGSTIPSRAEVINARWAISRASLARRQLWNQIYTHFSGFASEAKQVELQRLRDADRALLGLSVAHVAKWQMDILLRDWSTYCQESEAIRWKMKAAIGAEKRILYPMLRAAASLA